MIKSRELRKICC